MVVNIPPFWAVILTLLISPLAVASEQVYRCVQSDGQVSFQYQDCAGQGQRVKVTPAVQSGWTELRSGEQQLLKKYRARDQARIKARTKAESAKSQKRNTETPACWKKRRRLEAVSAKLRRGYRASQGESLRRKRDNYEEYLDKFCS